MSHRPDVFVEGRMYCILINIIEESRKLDDFDFIPGHDAATVIARSLKVQDEEIAQSHRVG